MHLLPLFPFPKRPSLPPFLFPTHHLETLPSPVSLGSCSDHLTPEKMWFLQPLRCLPFLQDNSYIPETLSHRTHFCLSYHLVFSFLIQISFITFICWKSNRGSMNMAGKAYSLSPSGLYGLWTEQVHTRDHHGFSMNVNWFMGALNSPAAPGSVLAPHEKRIWVV